ncbi:MAG: hypothetical protein EBQ85_07785 [Proteobacteria bacterium]|nr:hypothetical protein [Pseudomonadota bacterium]
MRPKVVVVALLSPSKTCASCGQTQNAYVVSCPNCHSLQPFPAVTPSYFEIFNIPRQLKVDLELLRRRFYELAQNTHPDKHSQLNTYQGSLAARWSTLINKAYQTLRDPRATSFYLLELYSLPEKETRSLPNDLAEAYFELQDLLAESPNQDAVHAFKNRLAEQKLAIEKDWDEIAKDWPNEADKIPLLLRLREQLNKDKYLSSMLADLKNKWEQS